MGLYGMITDDYGFIFLKGNSEIGDVGYEDLDCSYYDLLCVLLFTSWFQLLAHLLRLLMM